MMMAVPPHLYIRPGLPGRIPRLRRHQRERLHATLPPGLTVKHPNATNSKYSVAIYPNSATDSTPIPIWRGKPGCTGCARKLPPEPDPIDAETITLPWPCGTVSSVSKRSGEPEWRYGGGNANGKPYGLFNTSGGREPGRRRPP
jgi:hypothetical protein